MKSIFAASMILLSSVVSTAKADGVVYDTAGQFFWTAPSFVSSVNVFLVGGGGGGANGHQGGGGAGFVSSGTFAVNEGEIFSILVGAGGFGGQTAYASNDIIGSSSGGSSAFGALLSAAGGGTVTFPNQGGQNGSSGGGGACNAGSVGGNGGSGGAAGQSCQSGSAMPVGNGQGNYSGLFTTFTDVVLGFGAGGLGGTSSHAGGGGAGGVTLNGAGPVAASGVQPFSGRGGFGYGAGGGGGGFDGAFQERWAGGNGANGLVYLEFVSVSAVPEPGTYAMLLAGLCAMALVRRRSA